MEQENAGKFIHVDGVGRLEQLKERGEKRVRAYVYPPMTLEQRICFRQTLNAAQEPFDPVSIIQDLRILAKERNLDIHNPDHIKTLVRDMPEKVRKHEKDVLELSRWHSDVIDVLGESYTENPKAIGLDQTRNPGRVLTAMARRHESTLKKLGGIQPVSKQLADMYFNRRFAEDGRSQEGIRIVVRCLKTLPEDHPAVLKFFANNMTCRELDRCAKETTPLEKGFIVSGCTNFINMLLGLNVSQLTEDDKNALRRTVAVLDSVISEVGD